MASQAVKKRSSKRQTDPPVGPEPNTQSIILENTSKINTLNKFSALFTLDNEGMQPDLPERDSAEWDETFPATAMNASQPNGSESSDKTRFPESEIVEDLVEATHELVMDLKSHKGVIDDYELYNKSQPKNRNKYDEEENNKVDDLDWREDWKYYIDKKGPPTPPMRSIPKNSIQINSIDKKVVSQQQYQENNIWKEFLLKYQHARRHSNDSPKPLYRGLCLTEDGVYVDPVDAEIYLSSYTKFPTPEGVRNKLSEPVVAKPSEAEKKKPKTYMKNVLPWVAKWHPKTTSELTSDEMDDPDVLYKLLKRATQAGYESISTYKNISWKVNRAAEVMKHTELQNQRLLKQVENLTVALSTVGSDRDFLLKQFKYLEDTAAARVEVKNFQETRQEIVRYLKENSMHLAESKNKDRASCDSCVEYTQRLMESATMALKEDPLNKVTCADNILSSALNSARNSIKTEAIQARTSMNESLADRRVYDTGYRNGLIDGAQAARDKRAQNEALETARTVKKQTEQLLNFQFQQDLKDLITRSYNRGERKGTAQGIALGMNVMHRQTNGDASKQFKDAGIYVGRIAREIAENEKHETEGDGAWASCFEPGNDLSIFSEIQRDPRSLEFTALDEFFDDVETGWGEASPEPYSSLEVPYYEARLPFDLQAGVKAASKSERFIFRPKKHDAIVFATHLESEQEDDPWDFDPRVAQQSGSKSERTVFRPKEDDATASATHLESEQEDDPWDFDPRAAHQSGSTLQ